MVIPENLVGMFVRIRYLLVALACIGIAIAPQLSWAESHYRLAKAYAEKNDAERASTYYGLALKNASHRQVPEIASDYAHFLLEKQDFHKAELMLRQALTQTPQDEELIKSLARCLVLQEKVIEGLRYFKSIYSEADARKEIEAIYREQENDDMLVAVEKNWGESKPVAVERESIYIAAMPKPVLPSAKVPLSSPALPSPAVVAADEMANVLPVPQLPVPKVVVRRPAAPIPFVAVTPAAPISKSELFDTKIPIPVPRPAPLPLVAQGSKSVTKPAPLPSMPVVTPIPTAPISSTMLVPSQKLTAAAKLPAPLPITAPSAAKRTLTNPVKLAAAPQPVLSEKYISKSAAMRRPGRHYIINASASADMDALFPVKPVSAVVPVR